MLNLDSLDDSDVANRELDHLQFTLSLERYDKKKSFTSKVKGG